MLATAERPSTVLTYTRALRHYAEFCTARAISPAHSLPANPVLIASYVFHCLHDLHLQARTIENRVAALQFWHRRLSHQRELAGHPPLSSPCDSPTVRRLLVAIRRQHSSPPKGRLPITLPEFRTLYHSGFDLSRPAGHHQRLALLLLTLGCLRRSAAAHLRIFYTCRDQHITFLPGSDVNVFTDLGTQRQYLRISVRVDKNVATSDEVFAYIPDFIPSLGVRPVRAVLDYLRLLAPPSGGYLLAAPRGSTFPPSSFSTSQYTGFTSAFKTAYLRAVPSSCRTATLDRIGSHSGRKSLAQWLWDAYGSLRLIADVGHWRCRQDAANLYFFSSRTTILRCLENL